jgi:signal transduction histidine kinase
VKKLTEGADIIASGDLSKRVIVSSRDEIGELAKTFNKMAGSLQERSEALIELNRQLEHKVDERTRELKHSHQQVERAYEELKEAQVQLVQSEKMASLGQLVAGIAHEIKNPLNFIYGNTDFLRKYVDELKELIRIYETPESPDKMELARRWKEEISFNYVLEDLGTLIENFEEGAKRIHSIIGDLRAFSRLDSDDFRSVDLHKPIEQALNLIRHEYRDRITIHRDFGDLPKIDCNEGRLSQVFMNLVVNACQAIPGEGDIWIRTRPDGDRVFVEVEDNGQGIPPQNLNKVFEPFFTTKPVGDGTGLGLSISYGIIQQHNGTISVSSREGQGTLFRIELPLKTASDKK